MQHQGRSYKVRYACPRTRIADGFIQISPLSFLSNQPMYPNFSPLYFRRDMFYQIGRCCAIDTNLTTSSELIGVSLKCKPGSPNAIVRLRTGCHSLVLLVPCRGTCGTLEMMRGTVTKSTQIARKWRDPTADFVSLIVVGLCFGATRSDAALFVA